MWRTRLSLNFYKVCQIAIFLTLNNVRLDIDISLNTTKSQSLTDVSVVRLATQMRLPLSIGTSTASYYRSVEKTHLQGGYPFDYDGVCERLRWRPCFTSKGQAKMLAHTLKHSLHSQGLPELRRDQELNHHILHQGDALKALSTNVESRKSKLKRGGVSAVMLKEMNSKRQVINVDRVAKVQTAFDERSLMTLKTDWITCWMTGLRSCQMLTLRRGDLERIDGKWWLTAQKRHDPRQKLKASRSVYKYEIINDYPWMVECLEKRVGVTSGNDLVCLGWRQNHARYSNWIKRMAEYGGWESRYKVNVRRALFTARCRPSREAY